MEKLTNQKVLLLEDEVMERCGQHPMWMYLKTYQTGHAELPYEGFLLQKNRRLTCGWQGKERHTRKKTTICRRPGFISRPGNTGRKDGGFKEHSNRGHIKTIFNQNVAAFRMRPIILLHPGKGTGFRRVEKKNCGGTIENK